MNLIDCLHEIVQSCPDQIALIYGREQITYRELDERSRTVGAFFQGHGVQPGARALLLTPVGINFYAIFLGLVRIGAAVMLIDPGMGKAHMTDCCQLAQPDLFIGSPKAHLLRFTTAAIRQIPRKFSLGWWLPGSSALSCNATKTTCVDASNAADDPALITFTSGSTGVPKGICRTHDFLLRQHAVLCHTLPTEPGTIEMNTLPVFILSSMAQGATVVIPQSFGKGPTTVNPQEIAYELTANHVNRLLAAPDFCQRLVDHLEATGQTLPSIQSVYTGGGPVFPALVSRLQQWLPNAEITAVYGSTEAEPIAHINMAMVTPVDRQATASGQGLLAGKPVAEVQLAIFPDCSGQSLGPFTAEDFATEQLPAHCVGEIVVTGEHVQKRYLNGDADTTKFGVDDTIWHRTGDAGYLDDEGRLWLLGRCAARVIEGTATRYPFGIEAAAMSHNGVTRAAFVEVNGEGVLAVEAAQKDWPTLYQEIQRALPFMRRIERLNAIPVDARHGSKVRYGELRESLRG